MTYSPKNILIELGRARILATQKKLKADEEYYQAEEKFKAIKADIMMSEQVTGFGSRELREAQADIYISQDPHYQDYLQKKFISKVSYEHLEMIKDILSIAKTLSAGGMLDEDASLLLEGVLLNERPATTQ